MISSASAVLKVSEFDTHVDRVLYMYHIPARVVYEMVFCTPFKYPESHYQRPIEVEALGLGLAEIIKCQDSTKMVKNTLVPPNEETASIMIVIEVFCDKLFNMRFSVEKSETVLQDISNGHELDNQSEMADISSESKANFKPNIILDAITDIPNKGERLSVEVTALSSSNSTIQPQDEETVLENDVMQIMAEICKSPKDKPVGGPLREHRSRKRSSGSDNNSNCSKNKRSLRSSCSSESSFSCDINFSFVPTKKFSTGDERSSTEKGQSSTEDENSFTEKEQPSTEDESSSTEKEQSSTEDEQSTTEKEQSCTEIESSSDEKEEPSTENDKSSIQNEKSPIKNKKCNSLTSTCPESSGKY